MRIAHVIQSLDPNMGGPSNVAMRISAAQAHLGHQVTVLAVDPGEARLRIEQAAERVPYLKAVQLRFAPASWVKIRLPSRESFAVITECVGDADVVHIHGVWDPILLASAHLARRRGRPYVIRPAGMLEPWQLHRKWLKKRIALACGWRRMLDCAAAIHALNQDEARLTAQMGLRAPMEVIPNGIFFEETDPLPAQGAFYAEHPELEGSPFVLFLGRLHHKKGLDYLADAFAVFARQRPEYRLVVVGPDEGAEAGFRKQIHALGLDSRVHLIGALYGKDRYKALVDSMCFCLPSRQEGFSNAVLEALAAGAPVVISEPCHFPEVERTGAGIVAALDPQTIAAALLDICGTRAQRDERGQRGRALVHDAYTWQRVADQCISLYERVRQSQA